MQGAHVDFGPNGRSVSPDSTLCSKCGRVIKKSRGGLDLCNPCFKRRRIGRPYKFSKRVMDHALSLFDSNLSARNVSSRIKDKFEVEVAYMTCLKWSKKFRPDQVHSQGRPHDIEWNKKVSAGLKRYFEEKAKNVSRS